MPYPDSNNYTLGKGILLLKIDGETAYRDLGNVPDFKITNETEKVQHYSSREGMKKQDAEFITQHKASCSFTLDEVNSQNSALFALADDPTDVSQSSSTATDQVVTAVLDQWVPLGKNKLSSVVVTDDEATPGVYDVDVDYKVNTEEGLLMALSSGSITEGESLEVDYAYAAETREKISAGTRQSIRGHLLFIGDPPRGRKKTVKGFVSLSPTGERAYISDEIATMQFAGEFLVHADYTGVYDEFDRGVVA